MLGARAFRLPQAGDTPTIPAVKIPQSVDKDIFL